MSKNIIHSKLKFKFWTIHFYHSMFAVSRLSKYLCHQSRFWNFERKLVIIHKVFCIEKIKFYILSALPCLLNYTKIRCIKLNTWFCKKRMKFSVFLLFIQIRLKFNDQPIQCTERNCVSVFWAGKLWIKFNVSYYNNKKDIMA